MKPVLEFRHRSDPRSPRPTSPVFGQYHPYFLLLPRLETIPAEYRSWKLSLPRLETVPTATGNCSYRGWKLSLPWLETIPTVAGNYPYRDWKLSLPRLEAVLTAAGTCSYRGWKLFLPRLEAVLTAAGSCSYRGWKLFLPRLEADGVGGGDGGPVGRHPGHAVSQLTDRLSDPAEQTALHHGDEAAGDTRDTPAHRRRAVSSQSLAARLRIRLVPQLKIKIQDPQDPTPLQDFRIQDPPGSHTKPEF